MSTPAKVRADLRKSASPERARVSARYFKTGKGEYGEGDVFIGVPVPQVREVVRAHRELPLEGIDELLHSTVHEERLAAVLMLVDRFTRAKKDPALRTTIAKLYLDRLELVNSWDLVDSSAPQIVGAWLVDRDRALLDRLAAAKAIWPRRVAMIATQHFIKKGEADDALRIAAKLVADPHDLMHKAVGWMLREVGESVDLELLRGFLRTHAVTMPRTMLRYAIEKLDDDERKRWMALKPARTSAR